MRSDSYFIACFGVPLPIHSDQGKNVNGHLMHAVCTLLVITKTQTTAYCPSSNGQAEHYNRLVLQIGGVLLIVTREAGIAIYHILQVLFVQWKIDKLGILWI